MRFTVAKIELQKKWERKNLWLFYSEFLLFLPLSSISCHFSVNCSFPTFSKSLTFEVVMKTSQCRRKIVRKKVLFSRRLLPNIMNTKKSTYHGNTLVFTTVKC